MKIDKLNMRKVILDFPNQFEKGLKLTKNLKKKEKFENIIISGVGGSALAGNVLICWLKILKKQTPPIYIHRDYNLPFWAGKKSLIISISYSGNTEETISGLKEAIKKNLKVVGITSGGEIAKICQRHKLPLIIIPSGIQPRCATGYLFSGLFKILANLGIIRNNSKEVLKIAKELKKINFNLEKEGKKLAQKLNGRIPLIYTSNKFKDLARIWKIKFNENSKVPAFFNYFPELNHNEMVGFTNTESQKIKIKNFQIIILRDPNDHPRILKRMRLFAELLKKKGVSVNFVKIKPGTILFKIFSTLLLGDWVSYYLALRYNINPTPVKIVQEFKKKLKK